MLFYSTQEAFFVHKLFPCFWILIFSVICGILGCSINSATFCLPNAKKKDTESYVALFPTAVWSRQHLAMKRMRVTSGSIMACNLSSPLVAMLNFLIPLFFMYAEMLPFPVAAVDRQPIANFFRKLGGKNWLGFQNPPWEISSLKNGALIFSVLRPKQQQSTQAPEI